MQVVVADTTPIRYLAEIDLLYILPELFKAVVVPAAVFSELRHPSAPAQVRACLTGPPDWMRVASSGTSVTDPSIMSLDDGERAALVLSTEINADLILIDERKAVTVARSKGFRVTGTLGVLVLASRRRIVPLSESLPRLSGTTFYCSRRLIAELLASEGIGS